MKKHRRSLFARLLSLPLATTGLSVLSISKAFAQDNSVGSLERVEGSINRVNAQGTQALRQGQAVFEADRIVTGAGSEAVIKLVDGAVIALRPSSEINLAQYRFAKDKPQEQSVWLELVRGGMRKITGAIGKANPRAIKITTATATIGIRGTDFEVTHIEPPPTNSAAHSTAHPAPQTPQNDSPSNQTSSPANSTATSDEPQAGTYIRVTQGGTSLKSNEDGKQIDVNAGQSAFAPNLAAALAVGGAVVKSLGLLRNSPAKVFLNGKFDGTLQSLSDMATDRAQSEINRRIPSDLRRVLPDLGNIFRR